MVIVSSKHSRKKPVPQASGEVSPEPHKISASTPYDFRGKNLTPYGGLFPVGTMLEELKFQELIEEATQTVKRIPRVMSMYQFILGMVLALYVGFSRSNICSVATFRPAEMNFCFSYTSSRKGELHAHRFKVVAIEATDTPK